MGLDCGLGVGVLANFSDDPSSNPAGYYKFLYEKTKTNENGGLAIFWKKLFL